MMKAIYSFHTDKSFKLNKNRNIKLLDNSQIILE